MKNAHAEFGETGLEFTDCMSMRGQTMTDAPSARFVPPEDQHTLSFAQQRIWYLHRLITNKAAVNIGFMFDVSGPISPLTLDAALRQVLQRHEILRTAFQPDRPAATVRSDVTLGLDYSSAENEEERGRLAVIQRFVIAQVRQEFSLEQCPLMRVGLIRLAPDSHIFWVVAHQLIFDRFSIDVFLSDLEQAYNLAQLDAGSVSTNPPVQYAAYAHRREGWIETAESGRALDFWEEFLPQPLPALDLPGDRNRPAVMSYLGESVRREIPGTITESLRGLARSQGCTVETLLFAAFGLLLHRHTGAQRVLAGLFADNRAPAGARDVIGHLENMLAIPLSFRGNEPFTEFLREARHQCLAASQHETPFEYLVSRLGVDRDLSRPPICQVTFGYADQRDASVFHLGEAVITPLFLPSVGCKTDFAMLVQERSDQLDLVLEYSSDIYDGITAAYLLDRYETLLTGICESPATSISDLPILSEREAQQLRDWSHRPAAFEPACPICLIERQVKRSPHSTALVFEDQSYTYQQLDRLANQLAWRLMRENLGPGQLVGIYMDRNPQTIAALLAVWKVGAAYVPLDPSYPRERIAYFMADSGMRVVLASTSSREQFPANGVQCLFVETELEGAGQRDQDPPPARATLDDLAYVIYTSGSTGKPKGVEVKNLGVTNILQSMLREPEIGPGDTVLALTTLSFDISVVEIFRPLIVGAKIALVPRAAVADPFALQKVIDRTQATVIQATPATWRMLLDAGWQAKRDVQIIVGGEALSPDLARLLVEKSASVWNMYGPTETTVWATLWKVKSGHRVVIGKPVVNTPAYILDAALKPVPVGVPGELCLGGVQVARGYHARPERTAEKFVPNPFSETGDAMFRTGDLCRFLPDGNIEFLGRLDHQVKIRGFRIELGEIESLLLEHASVDKAVVIARDDGAEKRLVAYCIPRQGSSVSADELRTHLRRMLPDYMIPAHFVALEKFPLSPSGKIDRLALPAPERPLADSTPTPAARCDSVEKSLVEIWESILKIKPIRPTDNFFELGGDSLLAVRVMVEIEEVFGKILPAVSFFDAPTISQLADKIRSESVPSYSCVVPIQTEGGRPPLFLVHGIGGNVLGYRALAGHLNPIQPLYGIQAIGIDGKQAPLDSVAAMARGYVEEIRRVQPNGPYYLGGLSLGGVIALEMAFLLRAQGEEAGALLMLDSYAYGVERLAGTRKRLFAGLRSAIRRFALHARNLAKGGYHDRVTYVRKKMRTLARRTTWYIRANRYKSFVPGVDKLPKSYNAVAHAAWMAARRYVPKPYVGRVLVIRAKDEPFLRHNDPTLGWSSVVRNGLTVCEVAGDHLSFLEEPHVQEAAHQVLLYMNLITKAIDSARSSRRTFPDGASIHT